MSQTPSDEERSHSHFDAPNAPMNPSVDAAPSTPPHPSNMRLDTPATENSVFSPGDFPADASLPRFPVLRVQQAFYGAGVVAIYTDHLLTGDSFLHRVQMTEEMCQEAGEAELKRQLQRSRSIAFEDVKELREGKPAKGQSIDLPGSAVKFTLRLKKGKDADFLIPQSQVWDVRAALFAGMPDRYYTSATRSGGCFVSLIIFICSLVFVYSVIVAMTQQKPESLVTAVISLALALGGLYFLQTNRNASSKLASLPAKVAPEQKKKRAGGRKKPPLYSPALGWTFKIVGAAYLIACWSPVLDPLQMFFDKIHNPRAQGLVETALLIPAALLIYVGYQLCQRRYDPNKSDDTRKPILYLRPFDDDAMTSLQPSGTVATITGVRDTFFDGHLKNFATMATGRISVLDMVLAAHPTKLLRMFLNLGAGSAEETIVQYLKTYGPVIAIGRPGEDLPTPGAARMYTSDDDWQAQVSRELARSQIVVVQPGVSKGVAWELEQIHSLAEPRKVLICLVSFWKDPQGYEELCRLVDSALHIHMPRAVPFLNAPAFVYFEADWTPRLQEMSYKCPILWPLTGEAADLTYTLQPFVQGIHGSEREMPRRSHWTWDMRTVPASLAAIVVGLGVAIVPGVCVYTACQTLFPSHNSQQIAVPQTAAPQEALLPPVTQPSADSNQTAPLTSEANQLVPPAPLAPPEKITLSGKAVPYHFTIPSTLETLTPDNAQIEYSLSSPDKLLVIHVLATKQKEDVSSYATERLAAKPTGQGSADAEEVSAHTLLESTRTLLKGGVDWVEWRFSQKVGATSVNAQEITRACSTSRGTIYVITSFSADPPSGPEKLKLAEEVLDSFTME